MRSKEYRQCCIEKQRYQSGERRFRDHMEEAELEDGFNPDFDPDLDMGFDPPPNGYFQICSTDEALQSIDYFLREDQEEQEQLMWRSTPDYTELYYDFYHSITVIEAEEIEERYAHLHDDERHGKNRVDANNMVNMLIELIYELRELNAAEEERKRYPPLELEMEDRDEESLCSTGINDGWCKNLWRSLPGFTELYYDLYCTMPRKEVSRLVDGCLDIRLPWVPDWNTIFMLEALEEEGME